MLPFRSLCILVLAFLVQGFAQTKNPDMSIITDFRAFTHNDGAMPAEQGKLNLNLEEIEFAFQGYLNPYARADIFIAKHGVDGAVEIEEASATFLRGLPWGLNVQVGKYLLDFSKLNTLHPHAFPYVERPLLHQIYYGADGLNDTGINVNLLLPTGSLYSLFSVNVLKGDLVQGPAHDNQHSPAENSASSESSDPNELAYSARLVVHTPIGTNSNLQMGLGGLSAVTGPQQALRMNLANLDFKYKWQPNQYRALTIQGEVLLNFRKIPAEAALAQGTVQSVKTGGFFAFASYKFRKRWNAGLMAERLNAPDDKTQKYNAVSIFAGFSPMEESSIFRLLLKREKHPQEEPAMKALLQVVFSLGPHKPHYF